MKQFILGLIIFMTIQFNASCFSGIVFWEYNEKDSYEVMKQKKYDDLCLEKPDSVFIHFDDCLAYEKKKLEFTFSDEIIMDRRIRLKEYEVGNIYFSIVINDEIVITGLNRMGYFGANVLKEDSEVTNNVGNIKISKVNEEVRIDAKNDIGRTEVSDPHHKADIILYIQNNVGNIEVK